MCVAFVGVDHGLRQSRTSMIDILGGLSMFGVILFGVAFSYLVIDAVFWGGFGVRIHRRPWHLVMLVTAGLGLVLMVSGLASGLVMKRP